MRDRTAVEAAIAEGEAAHGPVDCQANNAGIAPLAKLEDQDPAEWREVIDINCVGVLNGMHAVMPAMKARRRGTIVNISSIAGRKSYPYHDVYCGTKFFVHAISEGARRNMAPYDVRVIVVSPGLTETDIPGTMLNEEARAFWLSGKEKVGGGIAAEDVANTILFAYQMPQNVPCREADDHPYAPGLLSAAAAAPPSKCPILGAWRRRRRGRTRRSGLGRSRCTATSTNCATSTPSPSPCWRSLGSRCSWRAPARRCASWRPPAFPAPSRRSTAAGRSCSIGRPGSMLEVFRDDRSVYRSTAPVPPLPSGMSMRTFVDLLFGRRAAESGSTAPAHPLTRRRGRRRPALPPHGPTCL